jgi:TP901 family phage tail tape measure protein
MASIGNLKIGIGLNTTGLIRDLKRSEYMLKKQGSKFKALGASLTSSITLPLLAAGGAGAALAVQLGDNFAKIENLVGVTGASLEDLRSGVARVSGQTAKSQVELSEALFAVTSAGLRGKEALDVLTQAAKASQVGLGDTKSIALASTAVLNAYGTEVITAARATDVLAATIKYGNLEAASLAPVLGKVIGPASQLGISFEEIGANVATFTRLGTGAEEAVTALGSVMNTFIKVTPQAAEALAEVGLTAQGVRDRIKNNGLADTLIFLTDTFDGNIEALAKVIPNIKALGNVLGTASAQGTTYREVVDGIYDSTGLVDQGFQNVSNTAGFQLKKALVDVQNAAIGLGNKLLPIALKIVGLITSLVNKFTALSSATQDTVVKFALIAAAAGPVLSVFGGLLTGLGAFKGIFATIIPNIIKFWGVLTGPIGLAALAFAALTHVIIKNWDSVKEGIVKVINSVITLYNENILIRGVVEGIVAYWKIMKRLISGIFTSLISLGSVVKKIFTGDFDSLGDLFKNAGEEIKTEAISYAEDVKEILGDALDNTIDPKEMIKPITASDVQSFVDPLINGHRESSKSNQSNWVAFSQTFCNGINH